MFIYLETIFGILWQENCLTITSDKCSLFCQNSIFPEPAVMLLLSSGLYAGFSKGGFYLEAVGNPSCGGLGVQPPAADEGVIIDIL